jgi:OOP family OmpA-OmpF porin
MTPNRSLLLILTLPFAIQICVAQDAEGCKDSPLIGRFPGSILTRCEEKADDAFKFTLDDGKSKTIEGETHKLSYKYPSTASKPQVVRNLNTALRKAGYTMVYDSGAYGDFTGHMGKTWIQIEVSGSGGIDETIVVEIALTQDVVANAAQLGNSLTTTGHSVVNGILFDTGKAEVKPESDAALKEVVNLLKDDAKLKLYVVGHTDNVGALAGNMDLSKRRASAVVQLLVTQYGVSADRLAPYGDGPYSPLASNDSEDGRTVNRRVELVKQ